VQWRVFDFGIHFHFVAVVFSVVPMNYNYLWWENVSLRRKQIVLILAARRLSGGRQGQPVRSGGWPSLILRLSLVQAGPGRLGTLHVIDWRGYSSSSVQKSRGSKRRRRPGFPGRLLVPIRPTVPGKVGKLPLT